jgi:hypothetical protein
VLTVISEAASVVSTGTVGSFLQLLRNIIPDNKKPQSMRSEILVFFEVFLIVGNQPFSEANILLQIH